MDQSPSNSRKSPRGRSKTKPLPPERSPKDSSQSSENSTDDPSALLDSSGNRIQPNVGNIIHHTPVVLIPESTRKWIRNQNEETNAEHGARVNEKRGQFVVDWIEHHCCLYEGRVGQGQYVTLMPWENDAVMRLFSWVRWSEDWGCAVRQYKQFSLWAPKKSGKSPFEAMIGLYMFCAEGEPGQKCYSVAFQKDQAMIAHQHVYNMVYASPALDAVCTVHRGSWQITHRPTRSTYYVISGDKHDKHGASKEGFNGSVFIDETHTVSNELVSRLTRAGLSRREPLFMECSTAGPDLNGYGYQRFLHCEAVNRGESYDPQLLHISYVANQDTPIEDYYDARKVERIILQTNPSIGKKTEGFVLSLEDALNDWRSSLGKGESDLREFAMYRTNLWLHSATAWLSTAAWNANRRSYTLESLKGYACFAGLDLSKVGDLTALVTNFLVPEDEAELFDESILPPGISVEEAYAAAMEQIRKGDKSLETSAAAVIAAALLAGRPTRGEGLKLLYKGKRHVLRQWPIFWLPEHTAKKMTGQVRKIMDWAATGQFNLLKTKVIDYSIVSDQILALRESHGLKFLAYDPSYSKSVVENLQEADWFEEDLLEVTQNLTTMSPLAQDYERGIVSQSYQHPGNLMLDWMASHCELYRATSGLVRPIKPEYGDYKKIDGIVAGVISMACIEHYTIDRIMEETSFSMILKTPKKRDANASSSRHQQSRPESAPEPDLSEYE